MDNLLSYLHQNRLARLKAAHANCISLYSAISGR